MLVDYAKQETVEPLKALKDYLLWGIVGAVMLFLGISFISLGVLRLVQTEGGDNVDGGSWGSLVPYAASLFTLAALIGLLAFLLSRAKNRVQS